MIIKRFYVLDSPNVGDTEKVEITLLILIAMNAVYMLARDMFRNAIFCDNLSAKLEVATFQQTPILRILKVTIIKE